MKLESVTLKNYKSFGDYETTLRLDEIGTSLITASNGSGKSNLIESIAWCLYGESSVPIDQVVNRHIKKNCKVSVKFSIDEIQYEVIRYRKHEKHGNNVYVFKDGENISMKGIKETQDLIIEIIHIPYNVMISSFLFSTETYSSFLRETQAKRLQIIEGVLLLKEVGIYYTTTKNILKGIEEEYQKAVKDYEVVEYGIETIESNITEYKEKAKKDLLSLREEKKKKEEEIKELQNKLAEMASVNIQKELDKIKDYNRVHSHNEKIKEQINRLSTKEDLEDLNETITSTRASIDSLKGVDVKKEKQVLHRIQDIKELNNKVLIKINELENSLEESTEHYKKLIDGVKKEKQESENELLKLKKSICFTCGQTISGEKTAELQKTLADKISLFDKTIDSHLRNIERIQKDESEIQKKVETLRMELLDEPTSSYTFAELESINEKIAETEKEYTVLLHRLESANKNKEYVDNLKSSLLEEVENSKYTKEELENSEVLHSEIITLEKEIEIISEKGKVVYDKTYVETLETKKEKLTKALKIREKKKNEIDDDRKHYNVLLELFSNKDSGFKKFFIEKVIDVFNERINFYLPFFFNETIEIKFDKDLKETINYGEFQVEFKSFSAGQKTRIDLAIAFSLFSLVKTFFSSAVNILVFDEILDMNLDVDGVNAVMGIIENMAVENSVFVISHREEYKENFQRKIIVDQRDGFSFIA